MLISTRPPVPLLGATMITTTTTTTTTAAMLGAVVAAVAGAALAPAVLPPAHAAAGEPGTLAFSFGEHGHSSVYEFSGINDIDVNSVGDIVVLDARTRDAIRTFGPNGNFSVGIDWYSERPHPYSVAGGPNGEILAMNTENVTVFDINGEFIFSFGSPRHGWIDLDVDRNGNIIVLENRSSIAVFDRNGTFAFSFGSDGSYYQRDVRNARDIAVGGPDDNIFVADVGHGRVVVFHPNGTYFFTMQSVHVGRSAYIDVGPGGEVVTSDHYGNAYVYYPNGTFAFSLHYVAGGVVIGPEGIVAHGFGGTLDADRIFTYNGLGQPYSLVIPPPFRPPGPPAYTPPAALPLSLAGGTFAFEFGSYGEGPGEFLAPRNIAFGPGGVIAVSDAENHRIQLFHPNGTFAFELGSRGSGPGELAGPYGLAFGPNGLLAVSDVGNHRVQVFRIQ